MSGYEYARAESHISVGKDEIMTWQERIHAVLEALAIDLQKAALYHPPPVDDWQLVERFTWDGLLDGECYIGGRREYDHVELARMEDLTEVEIALVRDMTWQCLLRKRPDINFVTAAVCMYQAAPDKPFLIAYLLFRVGIWRTKWVFWRARRRARRIIERNEEWNSN